MKLQMTCSIWFCWATTDWVSNSRHRIQRQHMCRFWTARRQGQHRARSWKPWHPERGICFQPWLHVLALAEVTYWNPGTNAGQQDTFNGCCLPDFTTFLLAYSISTFWKNNAIMQKILRRFLTAKQTIILYENIPMKHWQFVLNRTREKRFKAKRKSNWETWKLQLKISITKGKFTGKISMLKCCATVCKVFRNYDISWLGV